jgi:hypothetical protein
MVNPDEGRFLSRQPLSGRGLERPGRRLGQPIRPRSRLFGHPGILPRFCAIPRPE